MGSKNRNVKKKLGFWGWLRKAFSTKLKEPKEQPKPVKLNYLIKDIPVDFNHWKRSLEVAKKNYIGFIEWQAYIRWKKKKKQEKRLSKKKKKN